MIKEIIKKIIKEDKEVFLGILFIILPILFIIGFMSSCGEKDTVSRHERQVRKHVKQTRINYEKFRNRKLRDQASSPIPAKLQTFELKHGELLSIVETDEELLAYMSAHKESFTEKELQMQRILNIKAKITPSFNKKLTIQQNGYNIVELILNYDIDKYDFIAYWAVADMTDRYGNPTGEEKVISFRIPKSMIDGIKRQNKIFGNNVVDYADKVWIHPSLRE